MPFRVPWLTILLCSLLYFCHANGQQLDQHSVNTFRRQLSEKRNSQIESLDEISLKLIAMDSVTRCRTLNALNESDKGKSPVYRIRLLLLQFRLATAATICDGNPPSISAYKSALVQAYNLRDQALIFDLNKALLYAYMGELNYGLAAMHALTAIDMGQIPNYKGYPISTLDWYHLSYVLYHAREYDASINAGRKALQLSYANTSKSADTLDLFGKMNTINTMGLSYEKLNQIDSAFQKFNQAYELAIQNKNDFWLGVVKGNIGDVFFQLGKYDTAKVLLTQDYHASLASAQYDNAANSLQWLARIESNIGRADKAIKMLREASRYLNRIPQPTYKANVLYAYTLAFTKLGQADSVQAYMNKYLMLHDSIEKAAHDNRMEIIHMRMDNQANINQIIALANEKQKISQIRNLIIILILLIGITGFSILNRQTLRLKLQQQQVLEQKRIVERDAAEAKAQLQVFTAHLREKTSLVEKLQYQLSQKETSEDQQNLISTLSQQTILTDDDWEKFKSLFEKVYPAFFHRLRQRSPDITHAELRMAAFSKLQVPAKEIAGLVGISTNSVNKARQRLRTRLGLEPEANLEQYFLQL